ncbi:MULTISPECIES: ABC-2 family transporter protein [Phenylobacterium]|uniref:ABC-2 type transport system permease protein n=1 Tax=Phenylobacterium koreense TaxID=266125 RepID=A0ABV2ELH9_9CAUL
MRGLVGLYAAEAAASVRMSFADRGNFALQVAGMLLNDVVFLGIWALFFAGFRSVGGWGQEDVALLLGLSMCVIGTSGSLAGGYRDMAATILRGDLDALLTQPKGVISRLLARESIASAWADLAVGGVILTVFAHLSVAEIPLVVVAIAAGTTVYVSAAISFASMAFWIAGARSFARDLTDFTLLLSTFPGSIHQGMVKVAAFTILPAGFVVMAPVEMLRSPSLGRLAMVVAAAGAYAAIAAALFHFGLRRYRRGAFGA